MMHTACFSFFLADSFSSRIIVDSVSHEVFEEMDDVVVDLCAVEDTVVLKISSDALSSIRAAANSYLRWIGIVVDVLDCV